MAIFPPRVNGTATISYGQDSTGLWNDLGITSPEGVTSTIFRPKVEVYSDRRGPLTPVEVITLGGFVLLSFELREWDQLVLEDLLDSQSAGILGSLGVPGLRMVQGRFAKPVRIQAPLNPRRSDMSTVEVDPTKGDESGSGPWSFAHSYLLDSTDVVNSTGNIIGWRITVKIIPDLDVDNVYESGLGVGVMPEYGQVDDVGATVTDFNTTLTSDTNNRYNGMIMVFINGALQGQYRTIVDYTAAGSNVDFTGSTWGVAPANEDEFYVVRDLNLWENV